MSKCCSDVRLDEEISDDGLNDCKSTVLSICGSDADEHVLMEITPDDDDESDMEISADNLDRPLSKVSPPASVRSCYTLDERTRGSLEDVSIYQKHEIGFELTQKVKKTESFCLDEVDDARNMDTPCEATLKSTKENNLILDNVGIEHASGDGTLNSIRYKTNEGSFDVNESCSDGSYIRNATLPSVRTSAVVSSLLDVVSPIATLEILPPSSSEMTCDVRISASNSSTSLRSTRSADSPIRLHLDELNELDNCIVKPNRLVIPITIKQCVLINTDINIRPQITYPTKTAVTTVKTSSSLLNAGALHENVVSVRVRNPALVARLLQPASVGKTSAHFSVNGSVSFIMQGTTVSATTDLTARCPPISCTPLNSSVPSQGTVLYIYYVIFEKLKYTLFLIIISVINQFDHILISVVGMM